MSAKVQLCSRCGRVIGRDQRTRLIARGKVVHAACRSLAALPKAPVKQ